ncbi:metallopeptidase family M24-domain-containing protein [Xylariaceae sp. FL0594]|nr:metallopeptidase family M24-domain-containing protein [Xylariaceae sp. FL0594]
MEAVDFEHDLVLEDEFDALTIAVENKQAEQELAQKYPAKRHARRVARKLGVVKGLIYLAGQKEMYWEDSDQGPPFRQRRYFYYLSGADFAGCTVTYDIEKDWLTLWIPHSDPAAILWFGKTPSAKDCLARYDVHEVRYVEELKEYIRDLRGTMVYALGIDINLQQLLLEPPCAMGKTFDTTRLRPAMDRARVIKTGYEIAMIRKANAVSSAAHRLVAERIGAMVNECQLEGAFLGSCVAQNAHAQAYPVIAGSGANASTLHYDANNEYLAGRQLVVLDAGAEWACYASDVTRTLPIARATFSPEARAIYDLVHRMQEECIERVRPGAVFRDLHLHASRVAVEGLLELGILHNGTVEEIYKSGVVGLFFPHGLGHHVGLDVHDVQSKGLLHSSVSSSSGLQPGKQKQKRHFAGIAALRSMLEAEGESKTEDTNRNQLRTNMVVTIEPGIYFCRPYIESHFTEDEDEEEMVVAVKRYVNLDVLEGYYPVGGVRVEDCIRVTADGYENLTTAPKGEELLRLVGVC